MGTRMKRFGVLPQVFCLMVAGNLFGWENLPQKPYGQANLFPMDGQFLFSPFYSYTRWLHFYDGQGHKHIIPQNIPEEDFEVNDGMFNFEYGITSDLALDTTLGVVTAATRFFDPKNNPHTEWALMDTQIGLRYRLIDENVIAMSGVPSVTIRAGAIIAGTYHADFPFAPGAGGTGGELGLYVNKTLTQYGLNLFGDVGWRIRDQGVAPKVLTRIGLYQETYWSTGPIRIVTPHLAYKYLNSFGGKDVSGDGPAIEYPSNTREVAHLLEAGISFIDFGRRRYQFYFDWGFLGENTPAVMTYGLSIAFPFGGKQ
jgi:hypothetical protein